MNNRANGINKPTVKPTPPPAPPLERIKDIDGEKINDLVGLIRSVIDATFVRGIDVGYLPLGTLTIRLGPEEPKA